MDTIDEIRQLTSGLGALENQRELLGDSVVDMALTALRERLAVLHTLSAPLDRALSQAEQQRRLVTILFADISDFTSLSERMDAEDVSNMINAIWNELDSVVISHGGRIDKHLGDGILVIWGADIAREDDPERAIRTALEIQRILQEKEIWDQRAQKKSYSIKSQSNSDFGKFNLRIGINTGPALLGVPGTKDNYTPIGDTVNIATWLEQEAPLNGILISLDCLRHVRGIFEIQECDPVVIKGKSEPLQAYLVERVRPREFRPGSRGVAGIETHMVGREQQMEQLKNGLRAAVSGQPLQFFIITGDAGMGKSRLMHEFQKWAGVYPDEAWVFKARADQQREYVPFSILRDMLSDRFEIQEDDSQTEARRKLEQGIVDLIRPAGLEEAHFIGHLIGLDYSTSPYVSAPGNDNRQVRHRAYVAVMNLFRVLVEKRPILFLIEDTHWVDSSSLDLLAHFLNEFRNASVVVIATTRPLLFERFPNLTEQVGPFLQVDLPSISLEDSRALVQEILRKVENLPTVLPETIAINADGNPFFIEELIKMLIEKGTILKSGDIWTVNPEHLRELRVPPTLTGVLQARLDRLSLLEKTILHRASVVGRVFWDDAVAHLGETNLASGMAETTSILENLRSKELIFKRDQSVFTDANEYLFKSSILRDVTYHQVVKSQRRTYHRLAAVWLIEKSGDRAREYATLIAEHLDRAVEKDMAAEWYCQAAQAADESFAPQSVISNYERAIELMGTGADPARLIQPYYGIGSAYFVLARSADSLQAFHTMHRHAENLADIHEQLRAMHGISKVYEFQGNHEDVVKTADQAEALLRSSGKDDQEELAQLLLEKARAYYYQGKLTEARQAGSLGLKVALEADVRIQTARLYNVLGMIFSAEGEYERAIEYKTYSLERWREIGNNMYIGAMLNNIGESHRMIGDYQHAIQLYQQSLEMARQVHDVGQVVVCLNNMGGAYVSMGEFDSAIHTLEQISIISKEKMFTDSESFIFLAEAYLGQNNLKMALETAIHTFDIARSHNGNETPVLCHAWRVLGLVAASLGSPVQIDGQVFDATACFTRGLDIARKAGIPRDQAIVSWHWARYARQIGEHALAQTLWQEARSIFERLHLPRFTAMLDSEWPALAH